MAIPFVDNSETDYSSSISSQENHATENSDSDDSEHQGNVSHLIGIINSRTASQISSDQETNDNQHMRTHHLNIQLAFFRQQQLMRNERPRTQQPTQTTVRQIIFNPSNVQYSTAINMDLAQAINDIKENHPECDYYGVLCLRCHLTSNRHTRSTALIAAHNRINERAHNLGELCKVCCTHCN